MATQVRHPIWLPALRPAGAKTFATLYAVESFARATVSSVIPIQAYEILASEQGAPRGYAFGPFTNANIPDELYATGGTEELAGRLYAKAGLGPRDVDVAQIYDHFTGCVLMQLEDYGFCKRGEGGPFVETSGNTEFAGGTDESNIPEATREPFPKT